GAGEFIIPVRKDLQKKLGKSAGQEVAMVIELCRHDYVLNKDFVDYLETDANALSFFNKLTGSHQRYFSKWIDSAKTTQTRVERIARAVNALSRKQGYVEMIRSRKTT
ncbi:MAG TPA: YdeI/OmpD-associated family protein, partial [Saprospiraceae bacterium]|nr:YdeI/OmpD-associated family protein [Saprospiraceae bacterium]